MASDDSEDALEERMETIVRRAENFRDLLKDGEEVTIAFYPCRASEWLANSLSGRRSACPTQHNA